MKHKAFPLDVKEVTDAGEFSGYLSIFGNIDSYREMVMPGAFVESLGQWASKGKLPPILWQHMSSFPIGPFTKMEEDDRGLYVEGKLLTEDIEKAREAHALLKNNVISGMSIGYETIGEEWDKENRVRKLTKINLWEGSIVTFPANEEASVTNVKRRFDTLVDGLPSMKDFEKFLREAGFSKTEATAIASKGLGSMLQSESGAPNGESIDALKSIISDIPLTEYRL